MNQSIQELEQRKNELLAAFSALGDFRPGSVSSIIRRCGKPSCHCAQPGDPGHGPNFRLTFKDHGKTVTESFPNTAARRKAEREIGPVRYERAYYLCPRCHQGQSPRDQELDVIATEYSPGVRRMMGVVGSETPFAQGQDQLELLAGLRLTAKAVERQAEALGLRLYTEAWQRGWDRAQQKVVIGDGARWIWNLADQHFPGAVRIVDLYHAREHLWELSAKLFPADERQRKRWTTRLLSKLDQGKIEALVKALRRFSPPDDELAHRLANEADYFERNADRMRYPDFRAQGLFVSSGVVEAGCRSVIGARLKRSGMFWTVAGANAIIALRCCRLSGRFEDYWENRLAA